MIDGLRYYNTLLTQRTAEIVCQSLEVRLTAWQDKKVGSDDLEATKVFICDSQDLIGLIGLDKLLSKLFHLMRRNGLGKVNNKVVVEIFYAILGYLFKVCWGRLYQVHYR